ncbi:hypothetical protein MRX96_020223 [Rhipicephalus microplus]
MDSSEEGSLPFPATAGFGRSSAGPEVQGWSPPSPWSPPQARWRWELPHGSERTFRGAPKDGSYVADAGSSFILYPRTQKLSEEPTRFYDDTRATRRRHASFPLRPLATGRAVRVRG